MKPITYALGDIVSLKKPHPCGTNQWEIIRLGMDIRIKCCGCGHSVLMPRATFEKRLKHVWPKGDIEKGGVS